MVETPEPGGIRGSVQSDQSERGSPSPLNTDLDIPEGGRLSFPPPLSSLLFRYLQCYFALFIPLATELELSSG